MLQRDDFATRVGADVTVEVAGRDRLPLRVERVEDFGDGDGRRFSVFFHGPGDDLLPQGVYRLEVDGDAHDVFVVPVGREGDRFLYEAAFNRDGT